MRERWPVARYDIDKAGVRKGLAPRREPYWGPPVERGLYVGFRRLEHGGNWVARYRTSDGQRYRSLGAVSAENDYEAAKREARRWRRSIDAGVNSAEVETVAAACADYVDSLRKAKRDAAAADAERRFARTVDRDPLGAVKLVHLRERHLEDWRARMEAGQLPVLPALRGRPREPRPLSPASFKRTLGTVKAALNHAVRRRYVAPDKALEWQAVQPEAGADRRRDLYLTREQRRALLSAADGPVRDLLECVILTGCRPGDPAGVLRRDFDGRTGSVTFRAKTGARTIPLSPSAQALFARLAKGKLPGAHLFTQAGGEPWTAPAWSEAVRASAELAGLPAGVTLYVLRHCWISDAIVGGMDLLTVGRLTGTSLAMIERHYGHLVQGAARSKLATLDFM
jgi:integrase